MQFRKALGAVVVGKLLSFKVVICLSLAVGFLSGCHSEFKAQSSVESFSAPSVSQSEPQPTPTTTPTPVPEPSPEEPAPALLNMALLSSHGAMGDGVTDDTQALAIAFNKPNVGCLDGQNKIYRVVGSLRIHGDLCLQNAILVQDFNPVDTTSYIRSLSRGEPVLDAITDEMRSYPEDPVLSPEQEAQLAQSIHLRTLCVAADKKVKVRLANVKINMGKSPVLGSRGDSAAVWIADADLIQIEGLEISGQGRGAGLKIINSSQVSINHLSIHDLYWAPYAGDRAFAEQRIKESFAWNNNPIYEYNPNLKKFTHVRVQEQLTGLFIVGTENVSITNTRVERLMAYFDTGLHPWQADGITIGNSKNVAIANVDIAYVWEGIDMTGLDGVENFSITNATASDIFAFAYKFVWGTRHGVLENVSAVNAGYAGFVFGGTAFNILVNNSKTLETGVVHSAAGLREYWRSSTAPLATVSGFRVMGSSSAIPSQIRITNSYANNINYPGKQDFGFYNDMPGATVSVYNTDVIGALIEGNRGF